MDSNLAKEKLTRIRETISILEKIENVKSLDKFDNKYLGRKSGEITSLLKEISKFSLEEKREVGILANQVKSEMICVINKRRAELQKIESDLSIDVTLPTNKDRLGHLHPISKVQYELEDIFTSLGFIVLDGPELESEYYNFDALNILPTHPARDMWDTFFVEGGKKDNRFVMRTHTSPVQIRAMHEYGAPLRCIIPGQCYRNEATDARHEFNLHQVEGLMVDENISVANMISVMETFLGAIFKKEVKARLRPGYFPFVEPGFELDFLCLICNGNGCRVCKNTGWVEFMGAGLVHPNVLKAGKIDPKKYSGFAFGFGTERLLMMKYGIDNIRLFRSGDLRFLKQF